MTVFRNGVRRRIADHGSLRLAQAEYLPAAGVVHPHLRGRGFRRRSISPDRVLRCLSGPWPAAARRAARQLRTSRLGDAELEFRSKTIR